MHAELATKRCRKIVFRGVIHHFRRFEHVARHAVHAAKLVYQAHLLALVARVNAATEDIGVFDVVNFFAAAEFHGIDKLRVDVGEHGLPNRVLLRRFRREWVAHAFVCARGFHATLDAQLVH